MADRKKLSGAEYRKNRLKKEKELIKLKGTFTKYLVPPTSNVMEKNENAEIPIYETSQNEVIVTTISESSILKHPSINLIANNSVTNPSSESSLTILTKTHSSTSTNSNKKLEPDFQFDFNDPGTWPKYLSDTDRCYITKMRIDSNYTPDFSKSERDGRTLTKDWFYKVLKNGSKVKRSFLAYSETKNSLYCISCRMFSHMFSHESKMSSLAKEEGLANWKKLSDKIPEHENSSNHKHYFCTWKSLETSLGMGGIDKELQDAIQKEETHWKEVLHCIVDAILYLAKQGSPFRGTNERAMRNIQGLINLLSSKRENLVSEAMADAKIMAQNNGLETDFKEKRKRKKKTMPGEICEDEVFGITQEELFRGSLMEIIDRILSEMNSRFDALKDVNSKFGFLSGSQINEIDSTTLQVRAKTLADSYPDDLNKEELVSEIESFQFHAFEIDKSLRKV